MYSAGIRVSILCGLSLEIILIKRLIAYMLINGFSFRSGKYECIYLSLFLFSYVIRAIRALRLDFLN